MHANLVHSITGEWAGTTVVGGPGLAHLADTPRADIHQADTLPTPGGALLVGALQVTAVEAQEAGPDLSPEADLDRHCHLLVGGDPRAQLLVPLLGQFPPPMAALHALLQFWCHLHMFLTDVDISYEFNLH